MKNINVLYKISFFLTILLLISCEGIETPTDTDGDVTFFMEGTLDGQPLNVRAGQENVYMFTDYQADSSDLYHFEGQFAKTNLCTADCDEALKITISNYISGPFFDIDAAIFEGNYRLATQQIDSVTVYETNFQTAALGNSTVTPRWDFGNGQSSAALHPTHQFDDANPTVRLEVTDLFGCKSIAITELDLSNNINCLQDFYHNYHPSSGEYTFAPFGGAKPNSTYRWEVTFPQFIFAHNNSSYTINVPTNGQFQVCLTTTGDNGCYSQVCKTFDNSSNTLSCASAFQFQTQPDQVLDASQIFSNIEIAYTSPEGIVYSNKNGNQPTNDSYFIISSVSDFTINENGQPTKKIEANIRCFLFDENGNQKLLESDNFVFAIAFPE